MTQRLRIALLINPLAGLGGQLAMKGSDGADLRELAEREGPGDRSTLRAERALRLLAKRVSAIEWFTWGGAMGADLLQFMGFAAQLCGEPAPGLSSADDSRRAAAKLSTLVDLLLFVGGDGTARDVYDAVGDSFPVLGIPAGVKMHSSVFAVSPEAAGELLLQLSEGGLIGLRQQEVRDIDEEAFREGRVRTRYYGQMQVPGEGRFLQHSKLGGREDQALVAADIAAWLVEHSEPDVLYILGPGSTTAAYIEELGLEATLLGVDVIRDEQLLASDANEARILELQAEHSGPMKIIVTAIGGQGHIFGRGNQQISPAVIRKVGLDNIMVIAAKSKIAALEGRPLLVDTNDPELDRELCAYRSVITGYDDEILYRVAGDAGG